MGRGWQRRVGLSLAGVPLLAIVALLVLESASAEVPCFNPYPDSWARFVPTSTVVLPVVVLLGAVGLLLLSAAAHADGRPGLLARLVVGFAAVVMACGVLGTEVGALDGLATVLEVVAFVGVLVVAVWFVSVPLLLAVPLALNRWRPGELGARDRVTLFVAGAVLVVYLPGAYGFAYLHFEPLCLN